MATHPSPNDLTRQQLDELDALLQRMLALPLSKPEPSTASFAPPPLPEIPPPMAAPPRPTAGWRTDAPAAMSRSPHLTAAAMPEPIPAFAASLPSYPMPAALAREPAPAPAAIPATIPFEPRAFVANPPAAAPSYPAHHESDFPATTGTLRGVDAPATPMGFQSAFANSPPASDPYSMPPLGFPPADSTNDIALTPAPAAEHPHEGRVPLLLKPLEWSNRLIEGILSWFGPLGDALTLPAVKHLLGWSGLALAIAAGYWSAKGAGLLTWPR